MAGKAHHDRKIMENFLDLIEVIKDPDKYESAIAELNEKLDKVTAMVELVGPAKDIERLRSQSLVDKSTALKMIENAEVKADSILARVEALVKTKEEDADSRMRVAAEKEVALSKRVSEKEAMFASKDATLKLRETTCELQYKQGDEMLQEGRSLKAEFEMRIKKLQEAAS